MLPTLSVFTTLKVTQTGKRMWVLLAEQLLGHFPYAPLISFLSSQDSPDEVQTGMLLPIIISIVMLVLLVLACIVLVILSVKYQRMARKQVDSVNHEQPGNLCI